MTIVLSDNPAPGRPGIPPRWTRSDKDGVGTAYAASSRVWFTISSGVVNEVYYPTIDKPQVRDLQFLVTDGETFFHDTRRHLKSKQEYLGLHTLGYRITSEDPTGRYRLIKEVLTDPHQSCLLLHTKLEAEPEFLAKLRLFALLAPHLEGTGWDNNANVAQTSWGQWLTAHKGDTWLALGASVPFSSRSCGYVGKTDGWLDLAENFKLTWQYDSAGPGNVALVAELDLRKQHEFVLGVGFGRSLNSSVVSLAQSLFVPFETHKQTYINQWQQTGEHLRSDLVESTGDEGCLYRISHSLILAHEDKVNDGAMIASLSIPWGEVVGDENLGGYHLVWTRDMYHSVTGLLAAGHTSTSLRALIYLACTQRPDGGFYQNCWITGEPYWTGVQLDEVAFPIMLAWRLKEMNGLEDFNPYPMVLRAASFLIKFGPATAQERWEENSGYSPSTLAANIAGLICAADFARARGDEAIAVYLEEYADFLESHIEQWTVATQGTLLPGVPRHFIRIHPVDIADVAPDENPNHGLLTIRNRQPGTQTEFPAKDVIDGGFLELVRYGIRKGGDPLFEDSLKVVDAVLKIDTPSGPCWMRYNHDGYGQRVDGSAFQGWGHGHGWPLMAGERGHYELAAGRDARPYLRTIENFASSSKLMPEQVWTLPDVPEKLMYFGKPTGGAMPLLWAHAEYLKLTRSIHDGAVYDVIRPVAERYLKKKSNRPLEVWKFGRQARSMRTGQKLRVQGQSMFHLRWSLDDWKTTQETPSVGPVLGRYYVDIEVPKGQTAPAKFTFFWPDGGHWEGKDYEVAMRDE